MTDRGGSGAVIRGNKLHVLVLETEIVDGFLDQVGIFVTYVAELGGGYNPTFFPIPTSVKPSESNSEWLTRKRLIDPKVKAAGWSICRSHRENL